MTMYGPARISTLHKVIKKKRKQAYVKCLNEKYAKIKWMFRDLVIGRGYKIKIENADNWKRWIIQL